MVDKVQDINHELIVKRLTQQLLIKDLLKFFSKLVNFCKTCVDNVTTSALQQLNEN